MDPHVIDAEEVPMARHRRRPARFAVVAVPALAALAALAGCSSSPSSDGTTTVAAAEKRPTQLENEAYLLRTGWEPDQATCVSKGVDIDLEALLSAPDGGSVPSEKPGYDEFAQALRTCLREDTALSSTTAPAG